MKIALCFSGQPRAVKQGYEYYKRNLFDRDDITVTVFAHIWRGWGPNTFKEFQVIEAYDPASILIESVQEMMPDPSVIAARYPRVPPSVPGWSVKDPAYTTYCMLYSIFQAGELKTNYEFNHGMQFDWVIRSRTDYALNGKIPFDQLKKDTLYIPNCRMTKARDFGNDQFAFGSSSIMDRYHQAFFDLEPIYDDTGCRMIGEEIMSENWKKHGMVGENLQYVDMNNPFPPGEHNGTPHSLIRDDVKDWQL